jgi:hypothetical protein
LVSSSAQRTTLGDDAADRLVLSLDVMMRQVVSQHGGSVIKGTGDGLMAVFDAASDGLDAAVAAHQVTERHNRHVGESERVALRVGVSAGDVNFVAEDCFGTPVVEAARLQAEADPGSIFVSGLARTLAGSRGGHRFDHVGAVPLKGLAGPVDVYRVHWEPLDELSPTHPEVVASAVPMSVPLPARLDGRRVFVGRESERAKLRDALEFSVDSSGRCVAIVSGEPGIGKTSLAAAFGWEAHELGAVVLYGRCLEDRLVSYHPWVEALSHLCRYAPPDLLREHIDARGGDLARLVPGLVEAVSLPDRQDVDPETERFLLFAAMVDLLNRVADRAPLVLVLDDLHWADKGSLMLLRYFAGAERPPRSVVVATYRDSDVPPDHPLADTLAALYREPGVQVIPLVGLESDALFALLEAIAGHSLGDDGRILGGLLLAETDGNPFFVTETLRHLVESGSIAQDSRGHWSPTTDLRAVGLPVTVRDVIRRRVARLGAEVQRILMLSSVIGRDFDLDILASVAQTDYDATLDALEAATASAVVQPVLGIKDRFSFVHALIKHTLYDELTPARRHRVHLRVAEALTELVGDDPGDRIGELAHHWIAADPRADEALNSAVLAGQHAMRSLAPLDAVYWFQEALKLIGEHRRPSAHRRCGLLVELGLAERDAGIGRYRDTLLEAARLARDVNDAELLVRAALANTRGWASSAGSVDLERVSVLESALEAIGPTDSAHRARLLATLAAETSYAGDWRARLAMSDAGLAIARRIADDDTLSYVLSRRAHSIWVPDTLPERLANTAENLILTQRSPNPTARFWAAFYRIAAVTSAGDSGEIERHLDTLSVISEDVQLPLLRWEATTQRAWHALVSGRLDEADRLTFAALQLGTACEQPDAGIVFAAGAFLLRFDQGRLGEIVDLLAQTAADTPGIPGLRASLALALCELDRDEEAYALLVAESESGFAGVPYDQFWLVTLVQWGLVTGKLGEAEPASVLLSLLAPWADQLAFTGAHLFGAVRHAVALCEAAIGRYHEAAAHFKRCLAVYEELGAVAWNARLRLSWAEMLVRRGQPGDHNDARDLLLGAAATAERVGLLGIQRRAGRLKLLIA